MSEIYRRSRAMSDSEKPDDKGAISIISSTDDAVSMGDWREVLSHADGACDTSTARALLINHNPNQLAGGIKSIHSDGKQMLADADIDEDATMQSGVNVRKAVANRTLNGVSVGYTYLMADTKWDEDTRTLTVNKWRMLEASLTPIPADGKAQVRSLPSIEIEKPAAIPAAIQTESRMSDDNKKPTSQGQESAANTNQAPVDVKDISEKARASAISEARDIAGLAREHKLDAEKYIGKSKQDATAEMLRDLGERNKTEVKVPAISFNVDAADKARDAVAGALMHNAGFRTGKEAEKLQENNSLRGRGIQHIIKTYAEMVGERTNSWDKNDIAWYAMGRQEMIKGRAANVGTGNFPSFVFLNAITKIVAMGFEMGSSSIRYREIVENQTVPDFKQFSIGVLGAANLVQTAEDLPFPEITKAEGVFNSTAKMWGATMSLSLQALVNDDTAQFNRELRQVGLIADKTIDQRVFQKLMMGTSTTVTASTWTSNITSGATIAYSASDSAYAARQNLGKTRAALMNKTGLDSNPLGTMARFLICGPTRQTEAEGLMAVGPGQVTVGTNNLQVIVSPWLEASALAGNSTTSYYLLADPMAVTGLVLSKVAGYETPTVMQYDPGAVAAIKWKMFLPFEADLVNLTVGATATIAAAQQGIP